MKGKKRKEVDDIDQLEITIEHHKFHINKLEQMLRLIDNRQLEPSIVEKVRDGVDYYIQANREVDFTFDDECYEGIDLDIVPIDLNNKDDDSSSVYYFILSHHQLVQYQILYQIKQILLFIQDHYQDHNHKVLYFYFSR